MTRGYDLTGQKFGFTTAITRDGPKWTCRCDCGQEHKALASKLVSGETKSCGCYRKRFNVHRMRDVQKGRKYRTYEDNIRDKVDRRGPDECWPWTGGRARGYGVVHVNGKARGAHRVVYEMTFGWTVGSIPRHLVVMHKCDNPKCCNPNHLVLGTQEDNNRDRAEKGRTVSHMRPGEDHPSVRLTKEQVELIRSTTGHGTGRQLAERFGVAQSTISAIRKGRSWAA